MDEPDRCSIDDLGPFPVVRPASAEELGEVVRRAAADGQAVYPLGGRTHLHLGQSPTRPGFGVSLTALTQVIDYPARDMTVTVQAGIRVADLQRLLAAENQRLPVDVPQADRATLGGTLAANVSGPRRLGFGMLRDYVLGMTTVNAQGHETKAGGRVVKNVAGYDLGKLHIGALGTLGVITQVTLKVRPRPETSALVTLGCRAGELATLLMQVHEGRTRPVCVEALNARAARALAAEVGVSLPPSPWVVVVGFEESEDAVGWQVRQLIQEMGPGAAPVDARAGAACDPLWSGLIEFTLRPAARLSFKANLLPGQVADFCLRADEATGVLLLAHAGSGIVRGHVVGDLTLEQATAMLKGLTDLASAAQGSLVVTRCPAGWKRQLPVWGAPREDAWLMRRVKEKLDPHGLFNPGRFVDGI
jgi:glycolate oxidase FAD binding subunit